MKHLKKRLIAGFLALWMSFSLSSFTLAVYVEDVRGVNGVIANSVTAPAENVGAMPDDVFNVIMPTQAERSDMFSFILDPNNMLRRSSNALQSRFPGATLGPGNLFFVNKDEYGNIIGLSMESDEFKIVNKSSCPLLLELSVETSKNGKSFEFAKTPDFKNAEGRKILSPAIYLALVNGMRKAPILNLKASSTTQYEAKLKGWIEDPKIYEIVWDTSSTPNKFAYQLKSDVVDSQLPYTSFYMTGAINGADWGNVADMSFNVTWHISGDNKRGPDENPIPEEDTDPMALVVTPAKAIDDEVILRFDYGWGEKEKDRLTKLIYKYNGTEMTVNPVAKSAATGSDVFVVDTDEMMISIKAVTSIFKGREWKLRFESNTAGVDPVDIEFDPMKATDKANPSVSVKTGTSAATQIDDLVELTLNYGKGDSAMSKVTSLKYKTASGAEKTITAGAENFMVDGTAATVKAVKTAFEGSNWKVLFKDDEDGSFEAPFNLRASSVTIRNVDPSIAALTEEEKAHKLKDPVQMTFDLGSGTKYMTDVDRLEYTDHNGETVTVMAGTENVAVNGNTITVTTVRDIYTGSDWNIVFVNKDDDAYTYAYVPVDLLADDAEEAVANEPPSVFVHQAAKLTYDTVKLTINWGAGEEAMSAVTAVKYERDTGRTLSMGIANADLNVDLETGQTTVVAIPVMFNGSNWRVVMTNDKGETTEVPFDLRHETPYDNEQGRDPSVRVATAAAAANDWVELELDFGTQDKKMTQVNRFLYNRDNGNPLSMALTNPSLQVDLANGKVRIKASALILNGSNWRLELSNGDAHDAKVKEVSFDPKVAG